MVNTAYDSFRTGAGIPNGTFTATLAERHPLCCCTWIVQDYRSNGGSVFRLKYKHMGCRAGTWHSAMERKAVKKEVHHEALTQTG